MGAPLWAWLRRLRPRPRTFSHRRGQDGRRCRLGPGRGAEEPGAMAALAQAEIKAPLAARRLGLAAQAARTPCLLLSGHPAAGGGPARHPHPLAHRGERSSADAPFDANAPGAPPWQLTLERCRGEAPGRSFIVEFSHELFRFHLSAASSDRAAEAGETAKTRLADDRPFALVGNEERRLLLTAVNAASAAKASSPGMGLADARAICPHLLTAARRSRKGCQDALLALARWASCRYSPTLNVDGNDGLWLDVTGVPASLRRRGGAPRRHGAASPAPGSPRSLPWPKPWVAPMRSPASRHPHPSLSLHGEIAGALASLPVEALRLEPEIALLLKRLGLKRIGQLYDFAADESRAAVPRQGNGRGRARSPRSSARPARRAARPAASLVPISWRGFPSRSRSSPMKAYLPASTISRATLCAKLARTGRAPAPRALALPAPTAHRP